MPLGIMPTVDFVFKLLFGTVDNERLLIHLLNAVLEPEAPIVDVVLLNPFNERRYKKDKLSVVDVKVRDRNGDWYVIEMQVIVTKGLANRFVYYAADLYRGQLLKGKAYNSLSPAIVIAFVAQDMFPDTDAGHLNFQLYDQENEITYGNQIQVHLIQLQKYQASDETIRDANPLEQWVFFMKNAHRYDSAELKQILDGPEFQQATGVLEMVTQTPELRLMYDDEAKAALDRFSELEDAREEGKLIGELQGKLQGKLIGEIQLLQRLLKLTVSTDGELEALTPDKLQRMAIELNQRQASDN